MSDADDSDSLEYSPSDRRAVEKGEKVRKERDRAKKDFVRAALGSREGRIWFWDLLGRCGVFRNPWTANALVTAHACGEMNIGQEVMAEIVSVVPDYFATMLKENNDG
jgi:hypothetical protein